MPHRAIASGRICTHLFSDVSVKEGCPRPGTVCFTFVAVCLLAP